MVKVIHGGIFNDLGSGSNVDLRIMKRKEDGTIESVGYRNYDTPNNINDYRKFQRPAGLNIKKGATIVLSEKIEKTA